MSRKSQRRKKNIYNYYHVWIFKLLPRVIIRSYLIKICILYFEIKMEKKNNKIFVKIDHKRIASCVWCKTTRSINLCDVSVSRFAGHKSRYYHQTRFMNLNQHINFFFFLQNKIKFPEEKKNSFNFIIIIINFYVFLKIWEW